MHWQTVHWIAGGILALAWFSRIVEAAFGMPHVADIARPEWDRRPATPNGEPRVSIVVPARNEEEHIRETLVQLLALDYSNYEVIVVNDRSTDRTGQIMDEVADGAASAVKAGGVECLNRSGEPLRHPKARVKPETDLLEDADGKLHAEADRSVRPTMQSFELCILRNFLLAGWAKRTPCGAPPKNPLRTGFYLPTPM